MILYKIRDKKSGEFMLSSYWKKFDSLGDSWKSVGRAIAALNRKKLSEEEILNLEIVEFSESKSYSILHEIDRVKIKN